MREAPPHVSARGFAAGVNFILLRLFSLASLYLLIALFEKNEGVFIKLGCQCESYFTVTTVPGAVSTGVRGRRARRCGRG